MNITSRRRKRRVVTNSVKRFSSVIRFFMSNLLGSFTMDMSILQDYLKLMPIKDRKKLVRLLEPYQGNSENDYISALHEKIYSEHETADTIDDMWRDKRCKLTTRTTTKILTRLWDSQIRYTEKTEAFPRKFTDLKAIFKFDDTDLSILALLYFYNYHDIFDSIFMPGDSTLSNDLAARAVGISLRELTKRMNSQGSIGASGLLKNAAAQNFTDKGLIEQVLQIFFTSNIENKLGLFTTVDLEDTFPIKSFTVPEDDRDIILRLLKSPTPAHLLFHGKPGTGKTELARSIAKESGRKVFLLSMPIDDNAEAKRTALLMGVVQAEREQAILIADEMDFLINSEALFKMDSPDKGWLITLMESYRAKVIWISNSISQVHEAVLRRFHFSLGFKNNEVEDRIRLWQTILEQSPARHLVNNEMAVEFAARYEANSGAIATALETLKSVAGRRKMAQEQVVSTMDILLKRHLSLTGGRIYPSKKSSGPYEISALNTSMPAARILTAVRSHRSGDIEQGISVLLYGLSGTGKSAFAAHVAEEAGMPLITKRASDLLDMYVGGTEANIRAAFREAEEKNGMLLIDEVDTFLADRNGAQRSWERTQVNELLTCMEEYTGVFFCTTNLKKILDTAVMRRFVFKVEFMPLDEDGRIELFQAYFPDSLQGVDPWKLKEHLAPLNLLTPGDFRSVQKRFLLSGVTHPSLEEIIYELEQEIEAKGIRSPQPIGFFGAA